MVDETSASMLKKVVKFGDLWVKEVMTPRTQVVWIEQGTTLAEFHKIFAESPARRYPVCEGSADNVKGVIVSKDIHVGVARGELNGKSVVTEFMRPVYFVPRTKLVGELLNEMRTNKVSLAVVVSEYGGTSGIVTVEQLVDEIVGEVREDLVRPHDVYKALGEHAYQVPGSMKITEANESLGLELPQTDYETVAGFVLHTLGHFLKQASNSCMITCA